MQVSSHGAEKYVLVARPGLRRKKLSLQHESSTLTPLKHGTAKSVQSFSRTVISAWESASHSAVRDTGQHISCRDKLNVPVGEMTSHL